MKKKPCLVNVRHKATGRKDRWFYFLEDKTNERGSTAVYGHHCPRYTRTAEDFNAKFEFITPEFIQV